MRSRARRTLLGALLLACSKAQPPAPKPMVTSFRVNIAPILVRHCASAQGCHGDGPTDSVKLDLRASAAYAALVSAPAAARPGALRIKPSAPFDSFLLDKLHGHLAGQEGKAMPIDADTGAPLVPSPLPADFTDGVLTAWIAAGAPNN